MDDRELKWQRYEMLYQEETKQLDLLVKFNIFYYGITGAIISYALSNIDKIPNIMLSLWLPILMGVICGSIMILMAPKQDLTTDQMSQIADYLWGNYSPQEKELIRNLENVPAFANLDEMGRRAFLKEHYGIELCFIYSTYDALKLYLFGAGFLLILISAFCCFMFFTYKPSQVESLQKSYSGSDTTIKHIRAERK